MARNKRKQGDGTMRLRKDGRWEGRIVVEYDEKGIPKTKSVLAKTKAECEEKLKALQSETETPVLCETISCTSSGIYPYSF